MLPNQKRARLSKLVLLMIQFMQQGELFHNLIGYFLCITLILFLSDIKQFPIPCIQFLSNFQICFNKIISLSKFQLQNQFSQKGRHDPLQFIQVAYYFITCNACQFMQNKPKQNYAPFGSVAGKQVKRKKNQLLIPGPGAYEVSLPMITPIVQTIRKANNNVIVKLGHLGTAPFLAGGDRFSDNSKTNDLGPGAYQNLELSKHEKDSPKKERVYAAQKLRQIIKNPFESIPTITQIKKVTFDDQVQMPSRREKLSKRQRKSKIRGLNWSRMSQSRLTDKDDQSGVGPGSYQLPKLSEGKTLQRQPSCVFNSNSVRSFFDQIIFETNQDGKARQRLERKYRSDMVGPGSYEIQQIKERKFKFQFFGSTQQRK